MTTTTNVPQVKLNIMTQQQYNSATKVPTELYMITDAESGGQIIQVTTLPTASASELDKIYQYIGTTGTYTNGYFYKCVSDGAASPTYSWTRVDVQPSGGGSSLPSQTGHSGEFLTTDGTDPSWTAINALQNTATGTNSLTVGGTAATSIECVNVGITSTGSSHYVTNVGYGAYSGPLGTAVGHDARAYGSTIGGGSVAVGADAKADADKSVSVGAYSMAYGTNTIAIGYLSRTNSAGTILLSTRGINETVTDANTFYIANPVGTYKLLDSDGTIPETRLVKSINKYSTMPTAASTNLGWIVQYTGTTDTNYTHGYIYECVSDGASTPTYSWNRIDVQPAGGSLPSQSGNSGKFLSTDGSNLSWKPALINNLGGTSYVGNIYISSNYKAYHNYCVAVGDYADTAGNYSVSIGYYTNSGAYGIGIGAYAQSTATGAIQIGRGTNNTAGTLYVGLSSSNNSTATNYKLLDVDGTIPEARLASTSSASAGQALVLDSNLNATWSTVSGLPSQSGQSGKYLTTNGTSASWTTITFPTVDQTYSGTSTNAQSGVAVKSAIDAAISSVYKPSGTVAFANRPTLSSSIEGNVYNISDSFTTTSDFVEGSGKSYPAGTNIVCINTATSGSAVYKWDVLAGFIDLSGYQITITGGASSITSSNLTASKALVSNASGKVATSSVTSTELGYVSGVTSSIQTQLNNKAQVVIRRFS